MTSTGIDYLLLLRREEWLLLSQVSQRNGNGGDAIIALLF
jgi:hypothetical protein